MEQQAAASTTSHKEQAARNYRNRYNTDPEFREKERQRAAAYIGSRRDHYKRLWAARYAAKRLQQWQQQRLLCLTTTC
jgi:hypothetical protein